MGKRVAKGVMMGGMALAVVLGSAPVQAEPLPDLMIRSIELKATGHCGIGRPAVKGKVVVKNRGKGRAKALLVPLVKVWDPKTKGLKDADIKIKSLGPGESVTAIVRIDWFMPTVGVTGKHRFIVMADPHNRIKESNEKNNTYPVTVEINCPRVTGRAGTPAKGKVKTANAPRNLPDLVVDKVELQSTGACGIGRPVVKGKVVVRNVGKGWMPGLYNAPLIKVTDSERDDMSDADVKVKALGPGDTQDATIRIHWFTKTTGVVGERTFLVIADPKNKVQESNEKNNVKTVKLKINCP